MVASARLRRARHEYHRERGYLLAPRRLIVVFPLSVAVPDEISVGALFRNSVTPVWLLLICATGLSWWLGAGSGARDPGTLHYMSTAVVVVASIKVRFVIRYFMEVRNAAPALRYVCDALVVGVCGVLMFLYWQAL